MPRREGRNRFVGRVARELTDVVTVARIKTGVFEKIYTTTDVVAGRERRPIGYARTG